MPSPTATSSPPAPTPPPEPAWRAAIFLIVAGVCVSGLVPVAAALAAGIAFALLGLSAFPAQSRKASKLLIQVSVVLLGFRMNLRQVLEAGAAGMLFAAGTIAATFALGHAMGLWLRIENRLTALVSAGTAICGGSAIAATGAVIGATPAQMSVAIGTVFILNAVALYAFPPLGHWLGLDAHQFGTWAAVAIHDVSSVVGAASTYDSLYGAEGSTEALSVATSVKLARTLWIIPVAILAGWLVRRAERRALGTGGPGPGTGAAPAPAKTRLSAPIPWFIGLFVVAAAVYTFVPLPEALPPAAVAVAKAGTALALFLIGSGMSRKAIASVGWRPMALGVVLWVFISALALVAVRAAAA